MPGRRTLAGLSVIVGVALVGAAFHALLNSRYVDTIVQRMAQNGCSSRSSSSTAPVATTWATG